jgi:hypothetical protein
MAWSIDPRAIAAEDSLNPIWAQRTVPRTAGGDDRRMWIADATGCRPGVSIDDAGGLDSPLSANVLDRLPTLRLSPNL